MRTRHRAVAIVATETHAGDLTSTTDAVFNVRGSFNAASGATSTGGSETFTGCIADAGGTLGGTGT